MKEGKNCCTTDQLLHVPTLALFIVSHDFIYMCWRYRPWFECHQLIQLCKLRKSWIDLFKSFSDPLKVTTVENELFFENFEQVLAVVATHSHYSQVKLLVKLEYTSVIGRVSYNFIVSITVEFKILRKPAKDSFMRTYATMFVENPIQELFKLYVTIVVFVKNRFN